MGAYEVRPPTRLKGIGTLATVSFFVLIGGIAAPGVAAAARPAGASFVVPPASPPPSRSSFPVPMGDSSLTASELSSATLAQVTSDAKWIVGNQFANGAIAQGTTPNWSRSVYIEPYTANYAAIGLARAASVTGDRTFARASWRWLKWYAHNEQPGTGFVSDATMPHPFVRGDSSTPLGTMDSTDGYAGTFLLAAYDTMVADPSTAALKDLAAGIGGAVHAIQETQQPNGLTWATPTYQMAYLMDDAEAHTGLLAAASLEAGLDNPTAETSDEADAATMESGIQSLWDFTTGSFNWAETGTGVQATDWSYLYPDAAAQAWAVGLGAATPAQASELTSEVVNQDVLWDDPTAMTSFRGSSPSAVGYWPGIGWAFDMVGDTAMAQVSASRIQAAASAVHDAWPYTTEDAGQLIVLLTGGVNLPARCPPLGPVERQQQSGCNSTLRAPRTHMAR